MSMNYYSRSRGNNKKIDDKGKCDEIRKEVAKVLSNVIISLNEMNSNIQSINTTDSIIEIVKNGYVNCIE